VDAPSINDFKRRLEKLRQTRVDAFKRRLHKQGWASSRAKTLCPTG